MANIAEQFRYQWDAHLTRSEDISLNAKHISEDIVTPFLFFICRPAKQYQKVDGRDDDQRMVMCFRILLQSIDCADPKKNFFSLAFGSAEERTRWFYQAHKLFSTCSSTLAKYRSLSSNVGGATALAIALAMRLMVALTDINTWKNFLKDCMGDGRLVVWNLINWIENRNVGLYSSVRQYIMTCNSAVNRKNKAVVQTDETSIITASAITTVLRPFHSTPSDLCESVFSISNQTTCLEGYDAGVKSAAEQFCVSYNSLSHTEASCCIVTCSSTFIDFLPMFENNGGNGRFQRKLYSWT